MKRAISNIISSIARSELAIGGVPVMIRMSPRARQMRLRVDPRTRSVLLTVPRRVSRRRALAWAAGHRAWVEEALAAIPERTPIGPDSIISLFGLPHRLVWRPEGARRIALGDGAIVAGGPAEGLEGRVLRWLKRQALVTLEAETHEFAARADVMAAKVRVGDPISRWGSCSAAGTISYSWRLILAPAFVRRATVAHEVAHLVHLNHGRAFHALVEQLLGTDPKPARLWLRREGSVLYRIGRRGFS